MVKTYSRGRNLGGPLEYTVSEIINQSVDQLIDNGYRFTVINDEDIDEEVYMCDRATASQVH